MDFKQAVKWMGEGKEVFTKTKGWSNEVFYSDDGTTISSYDRGSSNGYTRLILKETKLIEATVDLEKYIKLYDGDDRYIGKSMKRKIIGI